MSKESFLETPFTVEDVVKLVGNINRGLKYYIKLTKQWLYLREVKTPP